MYIKSLVFSLIIIFSSQTYAKYVETIFGNVKISHPVIEELINSKPMQRLKGIDQSGTPRYFRNDVPAFSRYDHSIGVYGLLYKIDASLNEQIAGLLHDVSHTVFSHVGDNFYDIDEKIEMPYQDQIHAWYLKQTEIDKILSNHNIKIEDVLAKNKIFKALEQDLPNMCADRIEYNLHTGLVFNIINKQDVINIVNDLNFDGNNWYFTNPFYAKKFANLSLYFTKNLWGANWNAAIYDLSAKILKRSIKINLLSENDILFSTDKEVLSKLNNTKDTYINSLLEKCLDIDNKISIAKNANTPDIVNKPKFRGIDPLVLKDGKLVKLTSIDNLFAKAYIQTKIDVARGWKLNFIPENTKKIAKY